MYIIQVRARLAIYEHTSFEYWYTEYEGLQILTAPVKDLGLHAKLQKNHLVFR